MNTGKITIKDASQKTVRTVCGNCKVTTHHSCLGHVDELHQFESMWGSVEYLIIQCGGCKSVSFSRRSQNSEEWEYDEYGDLDHTVTETRYPEILKGKPLMEERNSLPEKVERIYLETHATLHTQKPVLAGIGLRAIVEAVCSERGATKGVLKERIDSLVQLHVLTLPGAEILHRIRLLGNKAAHEAEPNTMEELTAALDVVEHLLQTVYVIPHKASRLASPPQNLP